MNGEVAPNLYSFNIPIHPGIVEIVEQVFNIRGNQKDFFDSFRQDFPTMSEFVDKAAGVLEIAPEDLPNFREGFAVSAYAHLIDYKIKDINFTFSPDIARSLLATFRLLSDGREDMQDAVAVYTEESITDMNERNDPLIPLSQKYNGHEENGEFEFDGMFLLGVVVCKDVMTQHRLYHNQKATQHALGLILPSFLHHN